MRTVHVHAQLRSSRAEWSLRHTAAVFLRRLPSWTWACRHVSTTGSDLTQLPCVVFESMKTPKKDAEVMRCSKRVRSDKAQNESSDFEFFIPNFAPKKAPDCWAFCVPCFLRNGNHQNVSINSRHLSLQSPQAYPKKKITEFLWRAGMGTKSGSWHQSHTDEI